MNVCNNYLLGRDILFVFIIYLQQVNTLFTPNITYRIQFWVCSETSDYFKNLKN